MGRIKQRTVGQVVNIHAQHAVNTVDLEQPKIIKKTMHTKSPNIQEKINQVIKQMDILQAPQRVPGVTSHKAKIPPFKPCREQWKRNRLTFLIEWTTSLSSRNDRCQRSVADVNVVKPLFQPSKLQNTVKDFSGTLH